MSIVHIFNQPDFLLGRELMVHSWNARSIISQSKSKISLLLAFALIIGRHCKRVGEQFFVSLCVHDFPVFASNGSPLRLNLTVFGFFVTDGRCYFRLCMHIQVPCNARFQWFRTCRKQSRKNGGREKESLTLFEWITSQFELYGALLSTFRSGSSGKYIMPTLLVIPLRPEL